MSDSNDAKRHGKSADGTGDPTPALMKLLELTTRYPEIGPPLAELAFKIGKADIGERIVRMGTEGAEPGLEYYFVTVHAARRERRWDDVFDAILGALRTFVETPAESLAAEDGTRLLHLIRLGFTTLMFELEDVNGRPTFIEALAERLPALEPRMGDDPFYRSLLAQTFWYSDRERSEAEWARAAELGSELAWNARGTWYREAERDNDKAERAYRSGLEATPRSALLLHNVAQVLVDRASRTKDNPGTARRLLNEAEDLLRAALREDAPGRRHIHATRDRLFAVRKSLPQPPRKRKPEGQRGERPSDRGRGGGGRNRPGDRKKAPPAEKFLHEGKVSLGDVLLAKLKEQQ